MAGAVSAVEFASCDSQSDGFTYHATWVPTGTGNSEISYNICDTQSDSGLRFVSDLRLVVTDVATGDELLSRVLPICSDSNAQKHACLDQLRANGGCLSGIATMRLPMLHDATATRTELQLRESHAHVVARMCPL